MNARERVNTAVLFLCVANSSRSQMAEGFARELAPSGIEILSAGSGPTAVNRFAIRVMQEAGIDISSHRAKSVAEVEPERVGTVVTLCAEETCPVFPGPIERLHWPLEDPAAATGSDEEMLRSFRRVRDQIRDAVEGYFREWLAE